MPSSLIVPVATISQITPHPNADSLVMAKSLCRVSCTYCVLRYQ